MVELQMLDDPVGRYALLAMIAAAAWKIWLRLKQDTRVDRSDAREHRSRGHIVEEYDKVVDTLREEVARLAANLDRLSHELNDEREARYTAERRAAILQERVDFLERRVQGGDDNAT